MEQKKNLKRLLQLILFAFTALFAFLALAFKIYDVKIEFLGTKTQASGNGFQIISKYPEVLEEIGNWLGVYSIVLIIAIIVEVIIYGVMFAKKAQKLTLTEKIFVILNVVLSLIYMINGLNAKSTIEEQSTMYVVSTLAFVPFIIVAIFAIAYFMVSFVVKENFALSAKAAKSNTVSAADELVKYKQLLDSGAITQDDYEAKKKELLGL